MIPFKLTNYSLQHLFKHTVPVILLFGINITNVGAAATPSIPAETENRPGTLVSQPLHTSATAEPNIVFLLVTFLNKIYVLLDLDVRYS